jgi:hypothetical protein
MSLVGRGIVAGRPNRLEEGQDVNTGKDFLSAANFSGPLYDQNNNRLQQTSHIEQLKRFFGVPRRELQQDPYSNYSVENDTLPDAYKGYNGYLTQIVISKIENSEQWPITKMLPLIRHQGSVSFSWDQITFNDELMRRVPEESVPHLVTHKHERHSTNLLRYGIALRLEHGFYKTPIGQQTYAMNLRQIANAIIETSCYSAVTAVVHEAPYEDANDAFRDDSANNIINIESRFQEELAQFGALQKQDGGLDMIVSRAEKVLSDRGVNGTFWIFPQGTKAYAQGTPAEKMFWLSGRRSGEERDVIRDTIGNTQFFESRGFRLGENEFNHDPLFREQTIGTYFQMNGRGLMDVPPELYRTNMLDVEVYNENCDAFVRLSYMELMQYTGLFENWGSDEYFYPLTHLGALFFGKYKTWKQFIDAADPHGYFYATFNKLSKEKQAEFMKTVAAAVSALTDHSAPQIPPQQGRQSNSTPQIPPQQGSAMVDATPAVHGNARANAMMSSGDWKSSILSAIGSSVWNDITKESATKFADFIHDVQIKTQDSKIMQLYQTFVDSNKSNSALSFDTFSWDTLGCALLDIDKKSSVNDVFKNNMTPTPFEEAFIRQEEVLKNNPNNATQIIVDNLRKGDQISPQWIPLKGKLAPIMIPISPATGQHHCQKLEFKAFALTLTTSHLVLFQIDENVIEQMSSNGGLIEVANVTSSTNEVRFALLQYSVTMSAIYSKMLLHKQSTNNMPQIMDSVKKLINLADSVTGTRQILKNAVNHIQTHKLEPLFCQFWSIAIVNSIHRLLQKYILSTLDEQEWIQHIGEIMTAMQASTNVIELLSNFKQSATGARMSKDPADHYHVDSHLMKTYSMDQGSINSLYSVAQTQVDLMHKLLVPNSADQNTIKDPFLFMSDDLLRIYALIHQLPTSVMPQADKSKLFKQLVKRAFYVAGAPGQKFNAASLTKKFLEIVTTQLKAGSVTSSLPDVDYFKVDTFVKDENEALGIALVDAATQDFAEKVFYSSGPSHTVKITWAQYLKSRLTGKEHRLSNNLVESYHLIQARFPGNSQESLWQSLLLFENVPFIIEDVKRTFRLLGTDNPIQTDAKKKLCELIIDADAPVSDEFIRYLDPNADLDTIRQNKTPSGSKEVPVEFNAPDLDPRRPLPSIASVAGRLKIDGNLVKWCLKNNVYVPIQLICFRPHMRYVQGSAVFMEGGSATGNTLYANPDMQMADNVAQKIHVAVYTQNLKAIVYDKKKIVVMRNVLTTKYLGGYGVTPWDPLNEEHVDNYKSNELTCDMFVVPELATFKFAGNIADISGGFNGKVSADSSANMSTKYTLSKALSALWGWKNTAPLNNLSYRPVASGSKFNTIVFQDYCAQYNFGDKKYSDIIENRGHFSTPGACAPGAGKVRKGQQKYYTVSSPWLQIRA